MEDIIIEDEIIVRESSDVEKFDQNNDSVLKKLQLDVPFLKNNVEDPLGVKRELNRFAFSDNQLFSAVFDSATTDEEHAKIIEDYKKNASKVLKEKLNVKERKGGLLLYNSKKLIEIYRIMDHTFITSALYDSEKLDEILSDYE